MRSLAKIYYDPGNPASFSRAQHLIKAVNQRVNKKKIIPWLETQDSYTMHRPVRHRFPRRMYNVRNIDDVWEADLVDLRSISTYNDRYVYLLIVIDSLSKYAWVEPLRDKTSANVAKAFRCILARADNRIPQQLQTDRGKEFLGSPFQNLLKNKNIEFRTARNPDVKAAIAERFNRTLKERMWRYFTHTGNKRYIDVLDKFIDAYNHTVHSGTRLMPSNVTLQNAALARANLNHRYSSKRSKIKLPKYSIGDVVRISSAKAAFTKAYKSGWSRELFKIKRISINREPPVYILKDFDDEEIDGIFYEEELSRVREEDKRNRRERPQITEQGRRSKRIIERRVRALEKQI